MENIVGIFHSISSAEQAFEELIRRDIPEKAVVFMSRETPQRAGTRNTPEEELDKIRTRSAESSGTGKAMGTVLGATTGGTAGLAGGLTVATLMVPGLGLISAIGLGAAAILGVGGAAAGAKIGDTVENSVDMGASKEQVEFYHQLLQRGYSLVLANVRSGAEIATVREVFLRLGSQDVEVVCRELGKAA